MELNIIILLLAVLFYQVQSQVCLGSGQVISNPQVVAPPVVATTIVDNSVSNALANALQLLIVSDLIESRLGSKNCLNGLGPVIDAIAPGYSPIVDVVTPCVTSVDVVSPCGPVIDTIIPNYYGGITETIRPNIFGGYTETICANPCGVTETITPNYYGCWTETITPNLCGATEIVSTNIGYPNLAIGCQPNIYGGITEVISPAPCVQQFPLYAGVNEIIAQPCGPNYYNDVVEVISPCGPNYYGGVTEIISNPFYGGLSEVVSPFNPGCLGGITEVVSGNPYAPNFCGNVVSPCCGNVISPCNSIINGLPEVITPSCGPFYGGINDFSPFNSGCCGGIPEAISNPFIPNYFQNNYFGGLKEIIMPTGPCSPVAAEVLIPSAIPAQLTCNFGYMPTTVPCVSVNVEALPFENCGCGCNGYPRGIFY